MQAQPLGSLFLLQLAGTQGLLLAPGPLDTCATPSISLSRTNHPKRLLCSQTSGTTDRGSRLCKRHPSTRTSPTTAETSPNSSSGSPAGTLYQSGLQVHAHLGPCGIISKWDLLSQTCSTGAFPALWELMTLSIKEGEGWQSQCSGSLCLSV